MPVRPMQLFWPALLLLAAVSSVAIYNTYRLIDLYAASSRSHAALLELDGFLSDLKDVETGVRGYVLTRDQRFLEPYYSGNEQLDRRVARLDQLAESEPALETHLGVIKPIARQRRAMAAEVVDTASHGLPNGSLRPLLLASKDSMDHVRREVAVADVDLRSAHDDRESKVRGQAFVTSLSLALGVALSMAVLVWLFSLLKRENGRRRGAEGELRSLNSVLEQRVHERTAEVEEARKLLNAVFESMPDPLFLKDAADEFRYVMVNRAGADLLGREQENVVGHFDHELFPREESEIANKEDAKVIGPPPTNIVSERMITTALGKRSLELRKVALEIDDTGRRFVLGIARDLTEKKRLETQVREMQRLESVGRLTGGVAHDFNNLLAVIMGSVDLIRDQVDDNSDLANLSDEAMEAVRRGADLVRRLLAFARKQHLEATAVDLNERLPNVIPLLQRTLGENVRVQVNTSDNLWPARIDATQVDDALVNLAINARDAMPDGGVLTIETGNVVLDEDYAAHHVEVDDGEYVMLAVSDSGTGMSPDVIARAFEPFFTTKPEGKGTGLGLSQVYGWVKQSGGHIKIYSELGHGTTIKLYLPRAMDDAAAPREVQAQEPHSLGHEAILLVEDNPNVRRTVKRQLTDLGYSTIEADNAEAALELIRSGTHFDLLLTDVVMPGGMSGYDLAAEVEQILPGTKILFTSGYTELAVTGIQTARTGPLLSKPYTKRDLGRAVRSALDGGEAE